MTRTARSKSMRAAHRVTRHDTGAHLTQTRGAFTAALGRPCARHEVEADVPCWDLLGHPSVCGARITGSDVARGLTPGGREDADADADAGASGGPHHD